LGATKWRAPRTAPTGSIALNALLDLWWNESLAVYHVLQENFPLVIGAASRTIGTGGNFNTTRPLKILDGCFVRRAGFDTPVRVLSDRAQYDAIPVKTTAGLPYALFYDAAYPLGTIYFFYVPDSADTIYLNSLARLQSVAALTTAITLPPGYDQLIVDGLAINRAPEYGREAPADVKRSFARSMRVLKRVNSASPVLTLDAALLPVVPGAYNINSDV
jgi:hypothetical protein